jgi:hypothetical protein
MKNLLRLTSISFIFSLLFLSVDGQNTTIAIGSWRDHTPFNKAVDVAEGRNGII